MAEYTVGLTSSFRWQVKCDDTIIAVFFRRSDAEKYVAKKNLMVLK